MEAFRMKKTLSFGLLLSALICAPSVFAQSPPPFPAPNQIAPKITFVVTGRDFEKYPTPKRKTPQNKNRIEVLYFYYIGSPWASEIDQKLRNWVATRPYEMSFTSVPIYFEGQQAGIFGARIHYALVKLGEDDRLIPLLMQAIRQGRVNLARSESVISWMESHGVPRSEFLQALNAPSTKFQTTSIPFAMDDYNIKSSPTIVIDGKYRIESSETLPPAKTLAIAQFMTDKLSLGGPAP